MAEERRRPSRRPSWVRRSGPYKCRSLANGHILIDPSWPQYGRVWEEAEGGGPGFGGRMALAADLQAWLSAPYCDEEVVEGMARIDEHDRNLRVSDRRVQRSLDDLEQTIQAQDRRIVELEMELERQRKERDG